MAIPKGLAAKARLNMDDGEKVYIEVRQGSPLCHFYTLYAVRGRTRKALIARNRNFAEEGIEELIKKLVQHYRKHTARRVLETRIWIYRKRLYRTLLEADPSDLGLARVTRHRPDLKYVPIERLPAGSIPLQKPLEILPGGR
jgi:hypothetical protein